jgi:AcrR family transcriptional regulator
MATPSTTAAPGRGLRREPQQARSRERVRRLLAAAEAVLVQDGYDALTVRRIAAEAGVPVGTLYQFFPDKQAIVDALALTYLEEFTAVLDDVVDRAGRERWDDPVQTLQWWTGPAASGGTTRSRRCSARSSSCTGPGPATGPSGPVGI